MIREHVCLEIKASEWHFSSSSILLSYVITEIPSYKILRSGVFWSLLWHTMYLEEKVTAEAVDMVEYVAINLTLLLFLTPVFQYLWLCYLYWIISFSPSTWLFPISVHLLSIPETYFFISLFNYNLYSGEITEKTGGSRWRCNICLTSFLTRKHPVYFKPYHRSHFLPDTCSLVSKTPECHRTCFRNVLTAVVTQHPTTPSSLLHGVFHYSNLKEGTIYSHWHKSCCVTWQQTSSMYPNVKWIRGKG